MLIDQIKRDIITILKKQIIYTYIQIIFIEHYKILFDNMII